MGVAWEWGELSEYLKNGGGGLESPYNVPELLNNLGLKILRNKEILANTQVLVGTQPRPSHQSPLQKWFFGKGSQKLSKKCHSFLVLSNFTYFFYFAKYVLQNILEKRIFAHGLSQSSLSINIFKFFIARNLKPILKHFNANEK